MREIYKNLKIAGLALLISGCATTQNIEHQNSNKYGNNKWSYETKSGLKYTAYVITLPFSIPFMMYDLIKTSGEKDKGRK